MLNFGTIVKDTIKKVGTKITSSIMREIIVAIAAPFTPRPATKMSK